MNEKQVDINLTAPQAEILTSTESRNLFLTGQGGGKTFVIGWLSYMFVSYCPKILGLMAANTYGQLSESTLAETFIQWEKLGWRQCTKSADDGFFVVDRFPPDNWARIHQRPKSPSNKIFFKNGAILRVASLDNYKALDGQTLGWALLDETKDTKEDAVKKVIIGRLRQKGLYAYKNAKERIASAGSLLDLFQFTQNESELVKPVNPLFIFTTPYKELWLIDFFKLLEAQAQIEHCIFNKGDYFVQTKNKRKVVIASTYHNEKNLAAGYIDNLINDLDSDTIQLNVYGSPFGRTGSEYVNTFEREFHVSEAAIFNPNLPIHFTLDFNVNPYMSGLAIQLWEDGDIAVISVFLEYAIKPPKASSFNLGANFVADFDNILENGFYLYGDASGNNQLGMKNNPTLFDDVLVGMGYLSSYVEKRIPSANPRYVNIATGTLGRRQLTNRIFKGKSGVKVIIHPKCKEFINDCTFCLEDANGKLAKPKVNGIELRGHHLQAFEYFTHHPKTFAHLAKVYE